ncbi:MAG: hypothetical protein JSS27_17375 [Planctomycetes bacterium]|nr:hypothetical protein [Planctomycetota bacterium]
MSTNQSESSTGLPLWVWLLVVAGAVILTLAIAITVMFTINAHAACLTLRYMTIVCFFGALVLLPFGLLATLDDNSAFRRRFQLVVLSSVALLALTGAMAVWGIVKNCGADPSFVFP